MVFIFCLQNIDVLILVVQPMLKDEEEEMKPKQLITLPIILEATLKENTYY